MKRFHSPLAAGLLACLGASNAALTQMLAALEGKEREREARLTRLENALEAQSNRPVTASLRLK